MLFVDDKDSVGTFLMTIVTFFSVESCAALPNIYKTYLWLN